MSYLSTIFSSVWENGKRTKADKDV